MTIKAGNAFKPGSWWFHCHVCQFKYRSEEIRRRWDGQYVCIYDWEPRHEMDFIKARREKISVDPVNREPVDHNMDIPVLNLNPNSLKPITPAGG